MRPDVTSMPGDGESARAQLTRAIRAIASSAPGSDLAVALAAVDERVNRDDVAELPDRWDWKAVAAELPRVDVCGGHVELERWYVGGEPPSGVDLARVRCPELDGTVYLQRWTSDDGPDLHSHDGEAHTLVLVGGFLEQRERSSSASRILKAGTLNTLRRSDAHRLDLVEAECWSLALVASPRRVAQEAA